uniref:tRNA (adenine(58)-N(1))-methyltransferase catalytic subunit TRMT61A n=1 Tax=Strongyloides stercoralis TaxID=6248 RepID=A0A0K0EEU9_STRER
MVNKNSDKMEIIEKRNSNFMHNEELIQDGDEVVVYMSYGELKSLKIKSGESFNMRFGHIHHNNLIGIPFGSRVQATAGFVYILRPIPALWTRCLPRRTQILYTPDIGAILMYLDLKPGSIVCESGTGSGSLSHQLANAIAPTGHLYTHDIDKLRVTKVIDEFQTHGLKDVTTAVMRNVCEVGFVVENKADAVFLDLPAPWEAISWAKKALSKEKGGRIVSFSPCIEQVIKSCDVLRKEGFVQVETIEIIPKTMKSVELFNDNLKAFDKRVNVFTDSVERIIPCIKSNNYKNEKGKKRTFDGSVVEVNESELDECDDADFSLTTKTIVSFPHSQPTHTGYLTHATLLPYF